MTSPEYKFGEWYPNPGPQEGRVISAISNRLASFVIGMFCTDEDGLPVDDDGKRIVSSHWTPIPPPPASASTTETLKRE